MKDKKLIGSLMLLIAALLWGGSYGIQNILSNHLGTYTIIFIKTMTGIVLLGICFLLKKEINEKTILAGIIVGIVNGCGLIFQQTGIANTSVSKASFITGLYVVFVPVLGLFTRKKPKRKFWLAICIAFLGLYMLCMQGTESLGKGDLAVLISAVFFALQIILIDKYASEVDPLPFCAFQQITIAFISGTLMLVLEKPQNIDFSNIILPIIYTAFISGMAAQILQNKYQKFVEPTVASLIMSLESVFGTLSGWLLLNQTLSLKEVIGCILIFISIIIAE